MRTILFLVRKEYLQVFRDRATVFQIFFIPIVQLMVLANAATFEIMNARTHVVDLDRSAMSRRLVGHLTASGRFDVTATSASMSAADDDLLDRDVSVIVRIPRDFERDLVRRGSAQVQLVLNAEEGAAAGIVQSYAAGVLTGCAREINREVRPQVEIALREGARIDVQARGWYNPTLNYKHYMVPGIMVMLVTLIGILLTAQNIAREKELGTLEQLNVTPITKGQFIAGKLLPFRILALVLFSIALVVGRVVFGIPMRGSVPLVYLAAAVYLVVALGLGLWISTITRTQQQTMFVVFFIQMIFLLMSGIFTPIDSMPDWARALAQLNPVKHFVVIMRTVLVRGGGLEAIAAPLAVLTGYGVAVLTFAIRQYSKTTA